MIYILAVILISLFTITLYNFAAKKGSTSKNNDGSWTDSVESNTFSSSDELKNVQLWVNYIYLDTDERRRFAQVSHEYLIEQLQHTGATQLDADTTSDSVTLNYNHPIKSIYWAFRQGANGNTNDWFNYSLRNGYSAFNKMSDLGNDNVVANRPFESFKLQLNGHDRFTTRDEHYFRKIQPYKYHTRTPSKYIYMYSFGLKPEEHQPSGTCNFSRIDNAQLVCTGTPIVFNVFAVNYNVLRIMSGMGGLAYSN